MVGKRLVEFFATSKAFRQAAGVHILRTKTMPFKLSMAVGNCTSFDNIKFYNFYHNKTIFILSLVFAASRTYLGFIAICCAHKHIIVSDKLQTSDHEI